MTAIAQKTPDSQLKIHIDWQQSPLRPEESPTHEIGWFIEPSHEAGLVLIKHRLAGRQSTATFEGGVDGQAYLISAAIATNLGRVIVRVIVLQVQAG